jgi:hypothetical protein
LLEQCWGNYLKKLIDIIRSTTVVALIKITVFGTEKISSCFILVVLRITAQWTTTIGKIYFLPFELLKCIGNKIDVLTI